MSYPVRQCARTEPHPPHSVDMVNLAQCYECPGTLRHPPGGQILRRTPVSAIDEALALVRAELISATERFAPFHSAHEGYAVILEELDEMWDEVKANSTKRAREEVVQVAAMATRFLIDVQPKAGGE